MRGMIEPLFLKPAQIAHRQALLAWIATAVLEHECAHLLTVDAQRLNRRSSGSDEIPYGLVPFIGNRHRSAQPRSRNARDQSGWRSGL